MLLLQCFVFLNFLLQVVEESCSVGTYEDEIILEIAVSIEDEVAILIGEPLTTLHLHAHFLEIVIEVCLQPLAHIFELLLDEVGTEESLRIQINDGAIFTEHGILVVGITLDDLTLYSVCCILIT